MAEPCATPGVSLVGEARSTNLSDEPLPLPGGIAAECVYGPRKSDLLIGVGEGGRWILEGAKSTGLGLKMEYSENAVGASGKLKELCPEEALILLKASRAESLEEVFA